jgi:hypothetical protein
MPNDRRKTAPQSVLTNGVPCVLVATTAMLAFICFWRAAAVVLLHRTSPDSKVIIANRYFGWSA